MSLTYTWTINNIRRQNANDLSDVVIAVSWSYTGADANGVTGTFNGTTTFDPASIDSGKFVSYSDLTEDVVLGWVQAVINADSSYIDMMNLYVSKQIDTKVNAITVAESGSFPWNK